MYDNVNFEMPCTKCGATIKGFQTKDTSCTLNTVSVAEVCNFYSFCSRCKIKIEFFRKPSQIVPTLNEVLKDFDMDVREHLCSKKDKNGD